LEAVAQNLPVSIDSTGSWGIADITGIENSMGSMGLNGKAMKAQWAHPAMNAQIAAQ